MWFGNKIQILDIQTEIYYPVITKDKHRFLQYLRSYVDVTSYIFLCTFGH